MKKVIIVFIVLGAITVPGNAQFFIEGSIGVNYDDTKLMSGQNSSSLEMKVSPRVGYWLNDNIAVGARISLMQYIRKITDPYQEREYEYRIPEWRCFAFSRYKLWKTGKFSLLLDGSIGIGGSNTKDKIGSSVTKKIQSRSMFDINMFPAISYDLAKKFSIITTCDFLSLGFSSETVEDLELDKKNRINHFGFNTQSTIFNSLGNIQIGFIYNF